MLTGRRLTTAALALALVAVPTVALAAGVGDPAGDLAPEGSPPLLTAAQNRAIDLAAIDATVTDSLLTITVDVHGQHADRRVSEESGHLVLLGQDSGALWVFARLDSGDTYFAFGNETISDACDAWSVTEEGSRATYRIGPACFPELDRDRPVEWFVSSGFTEDGTGDSWSDVAPDQPEGEFDDSDFVSAPPLDFSNFQEPSDVVRPDARDISDTCDGQEPQTQFSDTAGTTHEERIDCISAYGITQGKGDGTYAPTESLSRGQTATFLVRTLEAAGFVLDEQQPVCPEESGPHVDAMERLITAGVLSLDEADGGCLTQDLITRAQMARWVRDALVYGEVPFGEQVDWFADDDGHPDEVAINQIAGLGIVTGRVDGTFGPDEGLSRGQMATFLARLLDAFLDV